MIGDAPTPEFALTAACCRWPPSASRDSAVCAAAVDVRDWSEFSRLVGRHRVAGLAQKALSSANISPPSAVARALAARAARSFRHNLLLAAETIRLQGVLDAAGIPAPALKGVALAQLAYGDPTIKQTRDIDLLIPPERAEEALQILHSEGYALLYPARHLNGAQRRAIFRYAREVQLIHRGTNVLLELQWRPTNNPLLLKGVDARSAMQRVLLSDGAGIRTLERNDLFAYLCAHGAQHAWSRLKWLADLNAFVSASSADMLQLHRHAQRIGAGFCAGQALLLCHQLLDLTLPHALRAEIDGNERLTRLAKTAIKTMTDKYAEAEKGRSFVSTVRVMHAQFLLGKGWAFFAAQYRAESVRTLDIVEFPLPRLLQFLYPFLRLPLWLWRRATAAPRGRRPRLEPDAF